MNEKISVILPIYNVESYLPKCLDSVIAQSYTNIEIILVDDGSPDMSGKICDEYAQRDDRITVYHIANSGVARAREMGVEKSSGDYIVFVDPDDWLPPHSIEALYSAMSDDVDLVVGGYQESRGEVLKPKLLKNELLTRDEYIVKVLSGNIAYGSPWAKLFRAHLFVDEQFPVLRRCQDFLMNLQISFKFRKVKLVDALVYNYLIRESSVTRNSTLDLEFTREYVSLFHQIMLRSGKFDKFADLYYDCVLERFKVVICYGTDVPYSLPWVKDVVSNCNLMRVSFKSALTALSIRFSLCWLVKYRFWKK